MLAYVTKMKCVRLVVFVLLESQMTHYIKKVKKVWNSRSTVPNVNSQLRCANCQQAHSAAYRWCPMFLKQKDIMEIKVNNKISYAEAAGKLITVYIVIDVLSVYVIVFRCNRTIIVFC